MLMNVYTDITQHAQSSSEGKEASKNDKVATVCVSFGRFVVQLEEGSVMFIVERAEQSCKILLLAPDNELRKF